MPPPRNKNSHEVLDETEILDSDDVELLDDSDIVDIDDELEQVGDDEIIDADEIAEIVNADDEIIESMDDESTGEFEIESEELGRPADDEQFDETPVQDSVGNSAVSEDEFFGEEIPVEELAEQELSIEELSEEEASGEELAEQELSAEELSEEEDLDEDPLSSFAREPSRQLQIEEYVNSDSQESLSDSKGASFTDRGSYELDEPAEEEATYRGGYPESGPSNSDAMDTQSSAPQMIFDTEDLSDDADWQDESEETPGMSFSDTGRDSSEGQAPEWMDETDQGSDSEPAEDDEEQSTRELLSPEGMEDIDEPGQADMEVNWSSLGVENETAMPDIGETKVDGIDSSGPALDDKTLIFSDDQAAETEDSEPVKPILLVVKGEDEGREFELLRDELTIGRGPDNDLVFADIACSRRHAMFEFDGENWFVSDLGSGNGTLLNGEKIKREILYDGDEIEVGSTVLQFIWPEHPETATNDEDSPAPSSRPSQPVMATVAHGNTLTAKEAGGLLSRITSDPRQKKILIIVSASFGGLILLMLLIRLILPSGPKGPTKEQLLQQQKIEKQRKFDKHLEAAKSLFQKKDWKGALLEIQQARKFKPDSDIASEYQEIIQNELSASSAIVQARSSMESKQWDVAMAALNRIDKESVYAKEAEHLKHDIDENMLSDLLDSGLSLMKEGKYHQALLKFDELKSRDPKNTQVDELRSDCQKQIDLEERRDRVNQTRKRRRRRRRVSDQRHRATGATTGQVLALYTNGEIDRAVLKAQYSGNSMQVKLLRSFRLKYNKGKMQAHQAGMAKDAIKNLTAALSLDKKISGGKGKYHDSIVKDLAKVCFIVGRDNMQRKKYPAAYRYFRKTLKYKPGDVHAKKQLMALESTAKTLFESAYIIKSSDPQKAIDYLKTVVQIVSPRNVNYVKAKKLLKRLRPMSSYDDSDSGF